MIIFAFTALGLSMKPFLEPSRKATTILLSILMLTSTAAIVGTAFHPANAASPSTPTFTNYELAGNPFRHGFSVGVTCPNSARTCQNTEGEPAIRADPSGNFYGSSENLFVTCSYDGGATYAQVANAFDANHPWHALYQNEIGNLAIDPNNHLIYQSFSSIANAGEVSCLNCSTHAVWIAVSIDGGKSFTDYPVYINPNTAIGYGHQFVNVSVDQAGNVYLVYTDDHIMYYSFSTTFGQTWSVPYQISKTPSNTAIMPWSAALGNGALDVVWYGTSYYDGVNTPDSYPMTASSQVYFAQNLAATTPGSKFTQNTASGIIHYGGVCESGVACTGNRDLLDDFGIAASPTTGSAAIIYTNDQYLNTALEPATTRTSGSGVCTQSVSNSFDCSHTDIAVQTGGSTLLTTPHHVQASINFEQVNQAPSLTIQISNIGDQAIASLSIQLAGQPLSLSWNPVMPLQSGQTTSTTTTSIPLGLVLTVGGIYQVTITATLSDGSTDSQTLNAIYTLGAGIGL